jgi:hypothetical protein
MDVASPLPTPASRRRPRWIVRSLFAAVILVVGFVASIPSLISWFPALRDMAIRQAAGDMNGDVQVQSLSVGWFQPLTISKVVVTPRQGARGKPWQPAIAVERIETDRGLWAMLTAPQDLGMVRIERPEVFVEVDQGKSNFGVLFPKPAATPTEPKPVPTIPDIGARVRIVDGKFRFESDGTHPWELTGINLGAGLTAASKSKSGRPEAVVEKGTLISHQALTVGMCDDVLKFVAPVVAQAAYVKGEISIELDDWRLPLGDLGSGEMGGRLTMHSVDTGPGPMTSRIHQTITSFPIINNWKRDLALPKFIQIAQESTVPFRMLPGGRIHHENLRFSIAGLVSVGTHGSVGLDETLDLTAEFGIHPPKPEERVLAVLRQLTDTPWPVNIRGTLGQPVIDASPIKRAGLELAFDKIPNDIESGRDSLGARLFQGAQNAGIPVEPNDLRRIGNLVDRLTQKPDVNAGAAQGAGGAAIPGAAIAGADGAGNPTVPGAQQQPIDGGKLALDIVSELLRRRAQMQSQRQQAQGQYPNGQYPNGPYPNGQYPPNALGPSSVAPNGPAPRATPYGSQPYGPEVPPLVAPAPQDRSPRAPATQPGPMNGQPSYGPPSAGPAPYGQPSYGQAPYEQSPMAGQPSGPFPRRPLLRKGFGLLRDTIEQALEPPAPPPPGAAPLGTAPFGTAPFGTPSATPAPTPNPPPRVF